MFADNIYDGTIRHEEESYINFHEIFNINPEIDEVEINNIHVEFNWMIYLIALYKLFSFAFKFTNDNPVLLYKFTDAEKELISGTLDRFINDMEIGKEYSEYIKPLYNMQYTSTTLGGLNINDTHTKFPNYLLEITTYKEQFGTQTRYNNIEIERP